MHTPPPSLLFSFFLFLRHSASEVPTLLLNWASCPTLYANEAPTTSCLSATLSLFPSFSLTLSLLSCPTHTGHVICLFSCDNSNSLNFCHFIFNYPIKQTRVTHLLYGTSSCFTVFRDDIKCYVMSLLHQTEDFFINECHIGKLNLHLRLGCLQ